MTPPPTPYEYVETPEALAALGRAMEAAHCLGLDTESDSMHSFFEKVCLLQVSLPGDRFYIVDPLKVRDMAPLRPSLEDPSIRKVLHGADYDIVCMKRDFSIAMRGTYCTMTAGLLLGLEKIGLADLVEAHFGVRLAKAFTRSDWAARPLSTGQLEYLVQDVQYLIPLMEKVDRAVLDADLAEEARIEFDRLEERVPASKEFDPYGFLRIRGARQLPERGRAVLKALVEMREAKSREIDRPAFKVIANDTLLRIAEAQPGNAGRLRGVKGVTPYVQRRYGDDVLEAVRRGLADPATVPDRAPPKVDGASEGRRMSFAAQKRHGRLKDWRAAASKKTGRTPLAILPNPAMFDVARNPPKDVAELAAMPGVGPHRAGLYGEAILRVVGPKKPGS